ncbi:CPA2 family monovalent cation:H+ antiporter-2 [Desulfitispora alkaliphila]|uniref:cation:proton antiporter n=1 Tax=Desulfitispora alkaliphila TaxID=622674 RepID=UPI003D259059
MEQLPFLLIGGIGLIVFFLIGYLAQKFKLPSVLLYIIIGIILAGLGVISHSNDALHVVAEIGIVLLFFLLGLEFPLKRMMEISKKVWPAGLLDVFLNVGITVGIALLFDLSLMAAILIGSVTYATSSSITAKMLEEKKRLANPEAEFILALLIFEDLVAPILVSFLAGVYAGAEVTASYIAVLILKIVLMTVGAVIIGYYGFRKLENFIDRHLERDFMPLFAIGIAFAYGGLALALDLSEVLGAFLAGVMLSETKKQKQLEHLILPVRNITLPFFFFWFGTSISLGEGVPMIPLLILITVWSIVGKLVVGVVGGKMYGLKRKVALRAGFSLVQRGEFSAIIAALAPPQLRIFSGIYILITAVIGVFMFGKAPIWAKSLNERFKANE